MTKAPQGLPARKAALAILADVLQKHRPLDAALSRLEGLDARDAGFARAIASETLRRFGQIEDLLSRFVAKMPPQHKAGPVQEILMAGVAELLFLHVAAHAAVDGANRLAEADNKAKHFKPLVNAVLRRVSREGAAVVAAQDASINTPDWLWQRWRDTYGDETAREIAKAHGAQAPLDIVTKGGAPAFAADPLFGNVYRVTEEARVEALPGFEAGDFWVQDAAATLPAHLLGEVTGQRVLDLCAAPGGKTAQLASKGAKVTAVEREASRAQRLRENLKRLKLDAEIFEGDMRDLPEDKAAPFVLLDAPCSATGTIRRHPDLPWIKQASDVTACAGTSAELLDHAAALVTPGGLLVFAVCSLEAEEGPEQIALFLERNSDFRREEIKPKDVFSHGEWITPDGDLRTLPSFGMDGFYAARLKRL